MTRRIASLAALLAAVLLLAACSSGGASPSASTAASTPSPSQTASPSEAASGSAAPSTDASALPSVDMHGDASLEDLLPDEIGGQQALKLSMTGEQFMTSGGTDQEFQDFLSRLEAKPEDVSVAYAFSQADSSGGTGVFAFQVKGASQGDLMTEFQASAASSGTDVNWETKSVGGKQVVTAKDPSGQTDTMVYLYGRDDIVFFVTAPDDATAGEIISALP